MKLDLDRTEAQAVAAACQIASLEWAQGGYHSQQWARIVNDIAAKIVFCVLSEKNSKSVPNETAN